jgi:hypothetical protein
LGRAAGGTKTYLSPLAVELEPVVVLVVAGALAGGHHWEVEVGGHGESRGRCRGQAEPRALDKQVRGRKGTNMAMWKG